MNIWLYLTGNLITGATIVVSAAFAVGKLSQIVAGLQDQLEQMRSGLRQHEEDLRRHEEHNQATFDVFHATLLQLAIKFAGGDAGKER